MNNDEFLKSQCNRYVNGLCSTLYCLKRGGYARGKLPIDYNIASCESHEIVSELEKLRRENEFLKDSLSRGLNITEHFENYD